MPDHPRGADRRRHPRYFVDLPITLLLTEVPVEARLVDISLGGVLFAADVTVQPGWAVSVTMTVRGKECVGSGHVVRADGRGFGVEFTSVNDSMRLLIDAFGAAPDDAARRMITAAIQTAETRIG